MTLQSEVSISRVSNLNCQPMPMTLLVVKDSHSLHKILKLTEKVQEFSSLKFSVDKCEACWTGGAKTS